MPDYLINIGINILLTLLTSHPVQAKTFERAIYKVYKTALTMFPAFSDPNYKPPAK